MHSDVYEGAWNQLKGEFQRTWGELTGDEIEKTRGDHTRLVGLLQERYGYTVDHAREEVRKTLERYDDMQANGSWNQIKGSLQETWGMLTDDDVEEIKGRRTALVGKLQERYGRSRAEAWKEVNAVLKEM